MGEKLTSKVFLDNIQDEDRVHIVDRSDLSGGAEGTSKQMKYSLIRGSLFPIYNKKWVIFGDSFSISLTNGYPKYVLEKTGMTGAVTNGVSGDRVSQQLDDLDTLLLGDPNYFDAFDICSLFIGVNDYTANTILGTVNDTSASLTYAGYLMDFIETVLSAKETISLFIITFPEGNSGSVPYKGANVNGDFITDFRDIIIGVGLKYSVKVINVYAKCQFNLQTIPVLTGDGLHPSDEGQVILGDIIANEFISYHR